MTLCLGKKSFLTDSFVQLIVAISGVVPIGEVTAVVGMYLVFFCAFIVRLLLTVGGSQCLCISNSDRAFFSQGRYRCLCVANAARFVRTSSESVAFPDCSVSHPNA